MVTISVPAEAFAAIEATFFESPGSQSGRQARPDGKGGLLVVEIRQRRLGAVGEVTKRSVSLASPCSSMSFATLKRPRRSQGSQTMVKVGPRTSVKMSAPSRGIASSLPHLLEQEHALAISAPFERLNASDRERGDRPEQLAQAPERERA